MTKFVKDKRSAELFELNDKSGYIVRFIENGSIVEDRTIQGKSMYYIVDTCENWCDGIIDPWI